MSDDGDSAARTPATNSLALARGWSHARAALLLLAALLAFFVPPLVRGDVLYPHDNRSEAGLESVRLNASTRAHVFAVALYLPEIHAHLDCPHASWLACWNPHNELGRPLFPGGIGRAYVVGNLLSLFTRDAFVFFTWSAMLAVLGTALFAFLFLRALALHPLACLAGAIGISIGPLYCGWQAIPMLQWGFCWCFAALLGIERWLRARSAWSLLGICFAVHSILLTGYPQHVLLLGWISASWLVLRTIELRPSAAARARAILAVAAAAALGVLSVAPVWIDLYLDWRGSVRADWVSIAGEASFDVRRHADFWVSLVSVLWPGDPTGRSYSLSALFAGLLGVSLLGWRRNHAWMWIAWIAIASAGTLSGNVYDALRMLGLVLSDWSPVFAALLPCCVLAAAALDRLLRQAERSRWADVAACCTLYVIAAAYLPWTHLAIDRGELIAAVLLALGTLALVWKPNPLLLFALLFAVVVDDGRALLHWQPREAIHTDSALVQALRRRTADGSRFAWIGPRHEQQQLLLPNQELALEIDSVHTANHFVSREFFDWARRLGPQEYSQSSYQRNFVEIADESRLDEEFLAAAGVSTLISVHPPDPAFSRDAEFVDPVHVSTLLRPGPLQARLPAGEFELLDAGRAIASAGRLRANDALTRRASGVHDRLRFEFEPLASESLLFISQQYNGRWKARGAGRELRCVRINELFQGVLVPAGVSAVELEFQAWSRFAIVPQALFALAALAALWRRIRRPRPD